MPSKTTSTGGKRPTIKINNKTIKHNKSMGLLIAEVHRGL